MAEAWAARVLCVNLLEHEAHGGSPEGTPRVPTAPGRPGRGGPSPVGFPEVPGRIRLAPHFYQTEDEMIKVIDAM